MPNNIVSYITIGISSLVLSTFAMAEDLPKDEWLTRFGETAPALVCKNLTENVGVNKILMQAEITFDKCMGLIPQSFDKCKMQSYYLMPDSINTEAAAKWGNVIGECIGTDFAVTYLNNIFTPSIPNTFPSLKSSDTTEDVAKTLWLTRLKTSAPQLICTGLLKDPARRNDLSRLNITYEKCLTLIPPLFSKCEEELDASLPPAFNKYNGEKWTQIFGQCIGSGFAKKYLLSTSTPQ
ncbi:MAG: hypothetical protein Q8M03_10440 [Legionella sp.]|nr:hypothetical protein [Legionella sp.]